MFRAGRVGVAAVLVLFLDATAQPITLAVRQAPDGKELLCERFDSLEGAVSKARLYAPTTQKTILLADGKYFLNQPLVLDHRDDGLTLAAQPGAKPVLVGGRALQNWHPLGDKLWAADLPEVREGKWDFRVLVVNGRMAQRARLPAAGFFEHHSEWKIPWTSTTGGGWQRQPTAAELTTLRYSTKDLGPWLNIKNAELTIYHMWDVSAVGVAAMDDQAQTLTFSHAATHPPGAFGVRRYVVWNVREGLTAPGRWFLDRTQGQLVYWPLPGENMQTAEVFAPTTASLIRVGGTKERPARRLTLRGLTLTVANAPLKNGGFGAGKLDGALQIFYAQDSRMLDLTIANVGGHGIKDYGSVGLTIAGCHIHHTGACGITFGGGVKMVRNNHLHHVGVLAPSAIALWGNGAANGSLLAHNEIHDVPYTAIACSGNHPRIESNLIYRAMQELHDGAGIYITYCEGITVRGNFIRDIVDTGSYGASAYYLDEQATNCLVEGNLALNVAWPSHNHMAKNNTLRNNVFVADRDIKLTFPKSTGYVLERNLIVAKGKLLFSGINAIAQLRSNVLFSAVGEVNAVQLDGYGPKGKPAPLATRDGTRIADPLLGRIAEGIVTFPPGSPAAQAGIQPLDVSRAGLQPRDEQR
jgi:hypothetical protein